MTALTTTNTALLQESPGKEGLRLVSRSNSEVRIAVEKITENDVLLGRGGKNSQHSGNENLRSMALVCSPYYQSSCKRDKPAIADTLVKQVQAMEPSGRFLKQGSTGWETVSNDVAREKASQCLRDTVAVLSKRRSVSTPDFSSHSMKRQHLGILTCSNAAAPMFKTPYHSASVPAMGVNSMEMIRSIGSTENAIWEHAEEYEQPQDEFTFVQQAVLDMDHQLADDDSALQRWIDNML